VQNKGLEASFSQAMDPHNGEVLKR